MTSYLRRLVLSAVLCAQISCSRLYTSESTLVKNTLLSDTQKSDLPSGLLPDKRAFIFLPGDILSSVESRQKRMFFRNKYHIRTQQRGKVYQNRAKSDRWGKFTNSQRGKVYQNSAKSDRWGRFTLSLDVPTTLMNILFNIAKTKNLQAKAEDNARLMARIGRRK